MVHRYGTYLISVGNKNFLGGPRSISLNNITILYYTSHKNLGGPWPPGPPLSYAYVSSIYAQLIQSNKRHASFSLLTML